MLLKIRNAVFRHFSAGQPFAFGVWGEQGQEGDPQGSRGQVEFDIGYAKATREGMV